MVSELIKDIKLVVAQKRFLIPNIHIYSNIKVIIQSSAVFIVHI